MATASMVTMASAAGGALGRALAILAACAAVAGAAPAATTSEVLREGNTAALAGDWPRVTRLVDPLLALQLPPADLGEAHRLSGIAAFFQQRNDAAETHFLAYLRIDLDGRLDPALYPPEVVAFFNDVASRHAAELRARRVRPRRTWVLTLLPPFGQFQNGERTKGYVLGGVLGSLLVTNLTTYFLLRSWCEHTQGPGGGGLTCNDPSDHSRAAARIRPYNIASGIGVLAVYLYGVYDGIRGYRRRTREQAVQPYAAVSADASVVGISGSF
jgi:hypothetical protein